MFEEFVRKKRAEIPKNLRGKICGLKNTGWDFAVCNMGVNIEP